MTKRKILIVDDEREFVKGLSARCRHFGLEPKTACNTLTAITVLDSWLPDVICLDVEMPTGDGLEFCKHLASDQVLAKIPVIILTGRNDSRTMRRCGELRAYYVQKSPDAWDRLRAVISELLDHQPEFANQPSNAY